MRFNEKIYWCKKKDTPNGIEEYDSAQEITLKPHWFSVQPANGYSAIQEFGNNVSLYQIAIAQPYKVWENIFREGDVFYLDGATPNSNIEEYNGETANYVVDVVSKQNEGIRVVLKRR